MSYLKTSAAMLALIAGIGLFGALLSEYEPMKLLGGALGFIIGAVISIWETIKTPKSLRNRHFTVYSGGRFGPPFRQDSRIIAIFFLGTLCLFSVFLWRLLFAAIE